MTVLTKNHLNRLIQKPRAMDLHQLNVYGTSISMADIDSNSTSLINKAIDARRLYLTSEDITGLVVNGEVSAEETRDD
jgi:ABC-type metal ion transport system substrate-binding protein